MAVMAAAAAVRETVASDAAKECSSPAAGRDVQTAASVIPAVQNPVMYISIGMLFEIPAQGLYNPMPCPSCPVARQLRLERLSCTL